MKYLRQDNVVKKSFALLTVLEPGGLRPESQLGLSSSGALMLVGGSPKNVDAARNQTAIQGWTLSCPKSSLELRNTENCLSTSKGGYSDDLRATRPCLLKALPLKGPRLLKDLPPNNHHTQG